MSSVTSRVIKDLTERSFPPLVLLNGDWGSGKTFLAKNELIPTLEKELSIPAHYLSLYGVESLENFRDKILSKNAPLFSSGGISRLKKLTTSITRLFDNGATEGVLSVLTGALKSKLLDETKNTVFVLDDLERVGNMDLINQILGESLNLVENNHNVYVVVIANKSQIVEHSGIEKVFQLQIEHTLSTQDIVHIIESDYSRHWNTEHSPIIINELESLKVTNLRVIKRAMQRFCPLKEQLMKIDGIHHDKAIPELFIRILKICLAYYTEKFSLEQIQDIKAYDQYSPQNMFILEEQENKEKTEEETKLEKLGVLVVEQNTALIDYCLLNKQLQTAELTHLHLPYFNPLHNIESFSRGNFHHFDDSELKEHVDVCKTYLLDDHPVDIDLWFDVTTVLFYLIENHYIAEDRTSLQAELERIANNPKKFIPSTSHGYSIGNNQTKNEFCLELQRKLSGHREDRYLEHRFNEIKLKFLGSFDQAQQEVRTEYEHKPYLHNFSCDELLSILDTWKSMELALFSKYIVNRYRAGNIGLWLGAELVILEDMKLSLSDYLEGKLPSVKTANGHKLYHAFSDAVEKLRTSVNANNQLEVHIEQ